MLYESPGVRVDADDGVATLWLDFPDDPVNDLHPLRLEEIGRGIDAAIANPSIELLVVRSAKPAGFCGGIRVSSLLAEPDPVGFANAGQRVLNRLGTSPIPTIAFVHGPCLGVGLELALACSVRLAVCGPDSAIGFPDVARELVPCWGGTPRLTRLVGRRAAGELLTNGSVLSGREAVRIGLFDDAFSERRAKIELRTVLDHFQRTGRSPFRRRWFWPRPDRLQNGPVKELVRAVDGEATERTLIAAATPAARSRWELGTRPTPVPSPVATVAVEGECDAAVAEMVGRTLLRGGRVSLPGITVPFIDEFINRQLNRGFVTPLEAATARKRLDPSAGPADLVVRSKDGDVTIAVPGGVPFPVGVPLAGTSRRFVEIGSGLNATDAATARVTGWLAHLGYDPVVVADGAGLVVRRILAAVFDEALRLASEGNSFDRIDAASSAVIAGGPLAKIDRLGPLEMSRHVPRLLPVVAAGISFYHDHRPFAATAALLWDSRFAAAISDSDRSVVRTANDLADRLEYRAINEAARCLDTDPFATELEIDLLAAEGAGVFASLGGPLAAADARGPSACVQTLSSLARTYGKRFTPAPGLVRRAVEGRGFRRAIPVEPTRIPRLRIA
jgi:enoyl-CoA hydratase/carnithine racemase/3-hydroxyacyl-CoA dehydrogenase